MKERRQIRMAARHRVLQRLAFIFVVTCSVTLLCPGSASAVKRKSTSAPSKVSQSSYPEEDEPLIDQIAMESNDNAHQSPAQVSILPPPSSPVGYTGFKINPNCKCGKSSYTSGKDGNPHPWTAAIFYKNAGKDSTSAPSSPAIQFYSNSPSAESKPSMLLFCTGALINDRYVVTASRCLQGFNVTDLEVWLSDRSIWTDHDQPLRSLNDDGQGKNLVKKVAVEKIIIHPDFDPSVLDNEIALLRLADPVKLSRRRREETNEGSTKRRFYTTPVCLPKYDALSAISEDKAHDISDDKKEIKDGKIDDGYIKDLKAIVTGWDKKGRTSYSLVQTQVPIVSSINKCSEMTNQTAVLNDNMICAGKMHENAIDSCSMDTGSPLVIYDDGSIHNQRNNPQPQERIRLSSPVARRSGKEDSRGHYTLVGVSSWLYGCTNLANVNILYDVIFPNNTAKPQIPGVYVKVSKYIDWLTHNTLDAVWCA